MSGYPGYSECWKSCLREFQISNFLWGNIPLNPLRSLLSSIHILPQLAVML